MVERKLSWLTAITRHPQAANLLMLLMLLAGFLASQRLNQQYFPSFVIPKVNVIVDWPGASPRELESGVVVPLERALTGMSSSLSIESLMRTGQAEVSVEFSDGTDMQAAMNHVRNRVETISQWPLLAEQPRISIEEEYEPVAKVSLTGTNWLALREQALALEQQLLRLGVARVEILGMSGLELVISPKPEQLQKLQLSYQALADQILARSQDLPAGSLNSGLSVQQLRLPAQRYQLADYAQLPIRLSTGRELPLSELAEISLVPKADEPLAMPQGQTGLVLAMYRHGDANMVMMAETVQQWLTTVQLPDGMSLTLHEPNWRQVSERLDILLENGASGLLLILLVLYLFLNRQIAFWVALGIPTAFAATLALLWVFGGTINLISLFALLMGLGIIVDDAVVVGEAAYSRLQQHNDPARAVMESNQQMFVPVLFSSLTTIAAFIPLMMLTDTLGTILFAIPLVIISLILASFFECFAVLPSHLQHSFQRQIPAAPSRIQRAFQQGFEQFRDTRLMPLIRLSLRHGWLTLLTALLLIAQSLQLLNSGQVGFDFFPSDAGRTLIAELKVAPDLNRQDKQRLLRKLAEALHSADQQAGGIVEHQVMYLDGVYQGEDGVSADTGSLSVAAELTNPAERDISNEAFSQLWRNAFVADRYPSVESLNIDGVSDGPPDADLTLELLGADYAQLKQAALTSAAFLSRFDGVDNTSDNLPWGRPELWLELTPQARAFGLTEQALAQQLYQRFSGLKIQSFYQGNDEIEVVLRLADQQRSQQALQSTLIELDNGRQVMLADMVNIKLEPGFASVERLDGRSFVQVTASLNGDKVNEKQLYQRLETELLPELEKQGVTMLLGGMAEREERVFGDLLSGLIMSLALVYALLVLFCRSWLWPALIMASIPLGVSGAILGHWFIGIDMSLLSLFGFFGLAGIIVNGAIILIERFKHFSQTGLSAAEAMEQACRQRIRPIFITTFTTIAGLLPLLMSNSTHAEFLRPMATSMVFGLLFGTLLLLLLIPSLVVSLSPKTATLAKQQTP